MAGCTRASARVFEELFKDLLEIDVSAALNEINTPALLVWGDQDAILSRHDQDALTNALPNARLILYPGAGHSPHWEEPDHFASDLVSFIEEVGARRREDRTT